MMKTDEQIKEAVRRGQVSAADAQLQVLLDIREHLKVLTERWRKPGRPRKKRDPKPAGK